MRVPSCIRKLSDFADSGGTRAPPAPSYAGSGFNVAYCLSLSPPSQALLSFEITITISITIATTLSTITIITIPLSPDSS